MSDAKATLELPNIARALDEIGEDTDRTYAQAARLLSGNKLKLVSSTTKKRFKKSINAADRTYQLLEQERGKILFEGKDTTKQLEKYLADHIAALDVLEKQFALFDGLAKAALGVALHNFFLRYGEYVGYGRTFRLAVIEINKIMAELEQAIKNVESAKIKLMTGTVITAFAILLAPVGIAGVVAVTTVSITADLVIEGYCDGAGAGKLENAWKTTDATVSTAKAMGKSSGKAWPVISTFIGTAFDMTETADAIKAKQALDKRLKDFMKTYRKAFADYQKFTIGMRATGKMAVAKYKDAQYAANSFRSKKAPRMQVVRAIK